MRSTTALIAALVMTAIVAPAPASAYPPITCGRISVGGQRYIVKSHGPSCPVAIAGVKAFMARKTSPRLYKCRRYGASIPAYCIGTGKYSKRYFFATKP